MKNGLSLEFEEDITAMEDNIQNSWTWYITRVKSKKESYIGFTQENLMEFLLQSCLPYIC